MGLVTRYSHLKKKDQRDGVLKAFHAVRAVGLALEKGWKLCAKHDQVTAEKLSTVRVSGKIELFEKGKWLEAGSCSLQLSDTDASLACRILDKERSFLHDLGVNVWAVDKQLVRGCGVLDLVCDFVRQRDSSSLGVSGNVWVELKVYSSRGCASSMEDEQQALEQKLQKLHSTDSSFASVLLLVAKVERAAVGSWSEPSLLARLFTVSSGRWLALSSSGQRVCQGQVKAARKSSLAQCWSHMEWHWHASQQLGLLKHFLEAQNLPADNPGDRAANFNKALRKQGCADKLQQVKLPNRPGKAVWVGSKLVFRTLHKLV